MYIRQSRIPVLLLLIFSCWIVVEGSSERNSKSKNNNAPDTRRGAEVLYGVNCGGDTHTDMYGVIYQKDTSNLGVASDFGLRLNIDRVHPQDEILYQTERYSPTSFGYEFPIRGDGPYVLVLKFSEVYFKSPNQKVFDVVLNAKHRVVENLDIYANVGYATAHDEIVRFTVTDNGKTLIIANHHQTSTIRNGRVRVDFVKGLSDNPKINAFFVVKGTVEDIPHLPPLRGMMDQEPSDEDDDDNNVVYSEEEDIQFSPSDLGYEGRRQNQQQSFNTRLSKVDVRSGPPNDDPWEFESTLTIYMPLIGSLAASAISFLIIRVVNTKL